MIIEVLKATNLMGVPTYSVERTVRGIGTLQEIGRKAIGGGGTQAPQYTFTSASSIPENRMVRINGIRMRVNSARRGISGYTIHKAEIDG